MTQCVWYKAYSEQQLFDHIAQYFKTWCNISIVYDFIIMFNAVHQFNTFKKN